jgi:hypothetical protein
MMAAFDCAKEVWLDAAEAFSRGYAIELAQFKLDNPMPQLRDFMKGTY